ncbi:unnamed protein product [Toxocara canis]|uniref:UAS domain-containing protein n=1 Tax=Toxocara canis TaxID=6265 RepID=A0A183V247_TOXCA|nr:unnamed protein product [Toxocara canis]
MRVDRRPMLPCEFSNIEEAMQHFVTVFEARYGAIHPTFHKGSLHDAIRDAFEAPGRPITDRRPLAVYLRDDNAVGSNIFANNVLCSDAVCSLLNASFVTWSWDVTLVGNKNSLMEWIDACRIQSIKPRMGRICNEQYPLLIVLTKKRGAIHCIDIACGYDSVEQVLAKLKSAIADYELVKNAEVVEQKCRIEREVLRREQEREYEFSKAQDRARREELQRQKQKQEDEESRRKDDEARKRRAEEEKERRNKQLAESLPSEPASTDKDVLTVRIRFPEGNTAVRRWAFRRVYQRGENLDASAEFICQRCSSFRFRRNEPLQHLVTFVESKGYDLHRHKILTSDVPRRDMVSIRLQECFLKENVFF